MLIVSDTSPITNLIKIGQLDILEKLFNTVVITYKVYNELLNYENQKHEIEKRKWILIERISNHDKVKELEIQLDAGEAEAIVLAQELEADTLVIDERKGRKIAEGYGLKIIGLLGILIIAKKQGYIEAIKPLLDELIKKVGFRVSEALYYRVLMEAEE